MSGDAPALEAAAHEAVLPSPAQSSRAWLAGARWQPYGLLLGVMLLGAGALLGGLSLQELYAPGLRTAGQSWIPRHPEARRSRPAPTFVAARSVEDLKLSFQRLGYELPSVGAGWVPRLSVAGLPKDLPELEDPAERKRLFLQTLLPLVLTVNEELRSARRKVVELSDKIAAGGQLESEDAAWLEELEARYRIERDSKASAAKTLLRRLDEVPVAMALAQGAVESGWGTSRFAQEGNALFGQRTWKQDTGLVPEARREDHEFRVRRYGAPLESVWSYVHNLNTSPAYQDWRKRRAELRAAGKELSAGALLPALAPYSEKGAEYVEMLGEMIRDEKLGRFQKAKLGGTALKAEP